MTFKEYLGQKKYSEGTISTYTRYSERFLNWLAAEGISPQSFTYTTLLDFMRYCQSQRVTKRTVHNMLGVIRHYANYLIAAGKRNDNPAAGIFIKGLIRKIPAGLLSMEELEDLYKAYSIQLNVEQSKKIMFGLMVYQGVNVGGLMRIESRDIKLKDGKIKIKGTKRTNERLLSLHANQMIPLQEYLNKNNFKEGSVLTELSKNKTSKRNINNRIKYMFHQLRQLNPKVINAKQIRSSVITYWLRQHNLRQAQYMAGHKYVSSTQRYQVNNLDDLQNELRQHHPMS